MTSISQSFRNLLDTVIQFLPKLIAFLIILIIGYIIARVLQKVINKVLEKSQYDASGILAKLVFYAVMLFVLPTSFGVFGPYPISTYLTAIISYLPKVFIAILILVIASAIEAGVELLANAASIVIIALGVIAALNQLEIAQNVVNTVLYASLAALVGIAVVAIGGGGIAPMRQRWEATLAKVEAEAPRAKREAQGTDPVAAVRSEAQQRSS